MDSPIQQIKDRLDIVEVVSGYLKLEKTGINLRACCPFHAEKTPSFFVSPARQTFRCFGCGTGGGIFDFVMKMEGIEFGDALRLLAKKAGIELKSFHQDPALNTKRAKQLEINEIANRFFEKQLRESAIGKKAKEYLQKRGLTEETIKKWRLGFSPDQWQALSDFLISRGFQRQEIVEAGLAVQKQNIDGANSQIQANSHAYDRFRGRIMFPIFDPESQVIGFGARVFTSEQKGLEEVKYINTPATLLYDKSRVLYGLNFAKTAIRQKNVCILTEGYTDVILSHQSGFENTVAASGTALTQNQLKILKRYSSCLLTAFDMDSAGNSATERGIELALASDFEVKVITMPQGKDPADVILESPDNWKNLAENSQAIMDFYFTNALLKLDKNSAQGKKEIAKSLLPKIKRISNKIVQAHWIQKLANAISIKEEILFEELKNTALQELPDIDSQNNIQNNQAPKNHLASKTRKELLEEKIIALCLKIPESISLISNECLSLFSENTQPILASMQKDGKAPSDEFLNGNSRIILENCAFRAESEQDEPEEIHLCLSQLKNINKRAEMEQIAQDIAQAEKATNKQRLEELLSQFNQLARAKTI